MSSTSLLVVQTCIERVDSSQGTLLVMSECAVLFCVTPYNTCHNTIEASTCACSCALRHVVSNSKTALHFNYFSYFCCIVPLRPQVNA
jgi:hypothetical protein